MTITSPSLLTFSCINLSKLWNIKVADPKSHKCSWKADWCSLNMNPPLNEACLRVTHSLQLFACQPVLWSNCEMKCFVYLSWHVCNLTNEYAAAWMIPIKAFSLEQAKDGAYFSPPPPACQSNNSVQISRKSCWWASVCQLWSGSIITLLFLQSHPSSFVRSITFGWSAAFTHQRETVISASQETVESLALMWVTMHQYSHVLNTIHNILIIVKWPLKVPQLSLWHF